MFCVIVFLSLIWFSNLVSLYIRNLSSVSIIFPFFTVCGIFILSSIGPIVVYFRVNAVQLNTQRHKMVIRGLIKIYKPNPPIRPTVNWREAPVYKLAKKLTKDIYNRIPLPYTFNVKNSSQLMNDLMEIPFKNDLKLASFVITICIRIFTHMN